MTSIIYYYLMYRPYASDVNIYRRPRLQQLKIKRIHCEGTETRRDASMTT